MPARVCQMVVSGLINPIVIGYTGQKHADLIIKLNALHCMHSGDSSSS